MTRAYFRPDSCLVERLGESSGGDQSAMHSNALKEHKKNEGMIELRSTNSAAAGAALFAGFSRRMPPAFVRIATISGSDFSCPCIIGYGSSPSRRGPDNPRAARSDTRSLRFRSVPFVRDGVLDHDGASAPCMAAPHILPSALGTASASVTSELSRLNIPPHTIAVYASWLPSPAGHATLATGRVLALTRAGLSPAGPDQLILTHPQISGRSRAAT